MQLTINPHIFNACLSTDSLSVNMILPGYISSVEEKGYLIDFGLQDGAQGFIKFDDCGEKYEEKDWLMIGVLSVNIKAKIINCIPVEKCKDKAIVYNSKISFETLKPGWLVEAVIKQVLLNGIYVQFLRGMEGTVFVDHLTKPLEKHSRNEKIVLRVIMVDLANKLVNLSAKNHIVNLIPLTPPLKVGTIIPSATVTKEAYGGSYYLSAPKSVSLFLHKMHTQPLKLEDKVENILVKEYNYFDGIHIASLNSSENESITWQSIEVGQYLTGTIERTLNDNKGVYVKINQFILGILPLEHMADRALSNIPEKLTQQGKVVKIRVFSVNQSAKMLILTRKKLLLKQGTPIIINREDIEPLIEAYGVVGKKFENGRLIKFFNDIVGFLPAEEIPEETKLKIGQTVRLFVAYNNLEQKRIGLSLTFEGAKKFASKQPIQSNNLKYMFRSVKADINIELPERAHSSISIGNIYTFKPLPIDNNEGLKHDTENFLLCKTVNEDNDFYVYVPKFQINDYKQHNDKLFNLICEGNIDKTFKGIVLNVLQPHNIIVVSFKPSLIWAKEHEKIPERLEDLVEKEVYYGFIGGIVEKGVFVHFLGDLKGFLSNGELENSLEKNKNCWIGKPLRVAITRLVDHNVYLSTKLSKIYTNFGINTKEKRKVQRAVLEELKMKFTSFYSETRSIEVNTKIWNDIHYGDYVKGTIMTIEVRIIIRVGLWVDNADRR